MKVAVVADLERATGFRLAGVTEVYGRVDDVEPLLNRADIAVVFMSRVIFEKIAPKIRRRVHESVKPVFIQLEGEEIGIKEMVKKVLGFEMR